jgi:hypothetical protein
VLNLMDRPAITPTQRMILKLAAGLITRDGMDFHQFVIPIHRKLPLGEAAKGHAAIEKDGIGKVLLLA